MAKQKKETKALTPVQPHVPREIWERDFGSLFDEFWRRPFPSLFNLERLWPVREFRMPSPAVDIFEEEDDLVVKADLPGMNRDEIEVNLSGATLTISGEKKKAEEVKEKDYYRSERMHGLFRRVVELPSEVQGDKVKATFKDGVLEIRLPKTEEAKRKERVVKVE